jgi:LuxR family maltose regulon positive regulatory protein
VTARLLTTKLYVPPIRPELVPRPRLIERLNEGLRSGHRLTFVSAPAGFGKTTLIAEWLGGVDRPYTWLSLDDSDNDPTRFFTYLLAAVQNVDPGIGHAAQAMLQDPQSRSFEPLLTSLVNDIAAASSPFVLVLDDYHLIRLPPIHEQLTFLLERQPPSQHLVIITREDPPLPLSRWRARGQMVEIRQEALRFTEQETTDLFRQTLDLELSSGDAAALHRRTEGWIAGLHLTALSMQGRQDVGDFVQSFAGDHRYILDYLMDEVFRRQPAELREFLLKTSILDRFSAPLCDAVCYAEERAPEQRDSRRVLRALENANVFVVPLDESRQWYRYHHLFADLLRHRLEIESQVDLALLHGRASQWYADNGFPADAVRHALAASDWQRAADLILGVADSLLKRGEVITLLNWFHALPDEVLRAHPQLCLELSWPLILTEQIDAAESCLSYAEQAAQQDDALLGELALAQAHIARVRGDSRRAIELSERALDLSDDLSVRSIAAVNVGMAQWYRGHLAEAEQALSEAQRAGRDSGNEYARWTAFIFMNRIRIARGQLQAAAASCRQMIGQGRQLPLIALAFYDLGRLCYEWNELDAAAEPLCQGLEWGRRSGRPELQVGGYATWAAIKLAQGEARAAQDALGQVDQLLEHADISAATRVHCLAFCILNALTQGDLPAASLAADSAPGPDAAESFPDYLFLMLAQARLLLAQGRREAAAERSAALHGLASQAGWQSTAIQARALQALAAPTPQGALAYLVEALTMAEPEGYVRTFVDLGEPMAALLQEAASQGIAPRYVGRLLAAFDRPATAQPPADQPLVDLLSDRELEILRLLAERLTYDEIARALYLSLNTVKTHVRNIYGKLGVNRRRAAAARARELGLIP